MAGAKPDFVDFVSIALKEVRGQRRRIGTLEKELMQFDINPDAKRVLNGFWNKLLVKKLLSVKEFREIVRISGGLNTLKTSVLAKVPLPPQSFLKLALATLNKEADKEAKNEGGLTDKLHDIFSFVTEIEALREAKSSLKTEIGHHDFFINAFDKGMSVEQFKEFVLASKSFSSLIDKVVDAGFSTEKEGALLKARAMNALNPEMEREREKKGKEREEAREPRNPPRRRHGRR